MEINLQTGLSSHSAAAKTPAKLVAFIQAVFNLKAPVATKIADSIVNISKEKSLVTPAIDAFLDFAKTAKQPEIDKAIKSKTVQNLKPVLAAIVKNKTFAGTIAAIKKFKFKAPSVKAPASANLKDELTGLESPDFSKMTPTKAVNYFYKQLLSTQIASELLDVLVFATEIENEYDQFDNADSIFFTVLEKFLKKYGLKSDLVSIGQLNKNSLLFMLDENKEDLVRIVRKGTSVVLKNSETGKTSTAKSMSDYIEALKAIAPDPSKKGSGSDAILINSKESGTIFKRTPYGITAIPDKDIKGSGVLSSYKKFEDYLEKSENETEMYGAERALNSLLGINVQRGGKIADDDNTGIYATHEKSRSEVVFLLETTSARGITKQLGQKVKANKYIVYTDTMKTGGPFEGTPSPIPGTLINLTFKEALAEFMHQVTLPAPIQKPSSDKTPTSVLKPTTAAKSLPYKTIQKLAEALFDVNDADEDFGVKERTKWFNSKYGTNFKSIIIEHLEADDVPVIDFITKSNVRTRMFSVAYAKRLARSLGLSGTQNDIGLVTIVRNKPVKNTARVNPLFASAMREVMIMS